MKLRLVHLYPDLLDLYGDRGNVMTLASRWRWRGGEAETRRVALGDPWDLTAADILFLGGGSDREQGILTADLNRNAAELRAAIADGLVVLAICGGYQLLGHYYEAANGEKYPGLSLLDLYTKAGSERMIGNVLAHCHPTITEEMARLGLGSDRLTTLAGFENHGGRTYLGAGLTPLGQVVKGSGNNGADGGEGVHARNVFGTYLHGPFLPKNPHIADLLLALAAERRGEAQPLAPLDDAAEVRAHEDIWHRFS